jgi:HEAT repeats
LGLENPLEVSLPKTSPTTGARPLSSTEQILATLAKGDHAKFASFFQRVRQAYPDEVTHIVLRYIATHPDSEAGREMAAWLASNNAYLTLLFDPDFLPLEEARRAIHVMRTSDARFASKLSRAMEETTAAGSLVRALTLLEDIEDYSPFYPRLCTLTWHPDNFIRSKAVLALCRMRPNRSLIDRQLESPDARVRANAVEALWHAAPGSATRVFQEALADDHHRVVVNALVGLYYHKDESYYDKMVALAAHPEPRFRAALAWALGRIPEPRLIPLLQTLTQDSSHEVRSRAASSLARIAPTANPV